MRQEPHVKSKFSIRNLNFWYGPTQALFDISLEVPDCSVVALIGPSGCGKSTFLAGAEPDERPHRRRPAQGDILLDGEEIYGRTTNLVQLRRRVGMVFQKSNPFPKSVFENVVFGCRVAGLNHRGRLMEISRALPARCCAVG